MYIDYLTTEIGLIEIKAGEHGVNSVHFAAKQEYDPKPNSISDQCKQQLSEYFNDERTEFDLPLDQHGTDFQQQVWAALLNVPYGKMVSYLDIAQAVNNPKAVRAVGAANGKNHIAIIVPCHRVIGSNGTLTGYASGLDKKKWLLQHEGKQLFRH